MRAVWMARDRALLARLREQGVPCCAMYGLEGYRLAMRAGVALLSNSRTGDVNRFAIAGRTRVIQLWHGTPIKKIGHDDTVMSHDRSTLAKRAQAVLNRLSALLFPAQREVFDLLTVMSEAAVEPFLTSFRIDRRKVIVSGIARSDRLLARKDEAHTGPRQVIYLPTFRGAVDSEWEALAGFEPERVGAFLAERDAELFLKLHPANVPGPDTLRRIAACPRLHLMGPGDIHEHLPRFDVLVTDYSSIFVDYLLLDRPIVFFPYDYERYVVRDRELYYDYDRVTPGPKVRSWDGVLAEIDRALADPSRDGEERARVRAFFHDRTDGRSCERIFAAIVDAASSRVSGRLA
jgi:CDP-glycerol glycerophosphotransferase (TagB/SpsB family)